MNGSWPQGPGPAYDAGTFKGAGSYMWYAAAADVVVVIHLLFIGFVVAGAFLTWRWPWIIWPHLPAVGYAALVEFVGFTCPLTLLENDLRQLAGEAGYHGGFVSRYVIKLIYPPGLTEDMQFGLGVLVLILAIVGYVGLLRRQRDRPTLELSENPTKT